jgi:hypothetical protein
MWKETDIVMAVGDNTPEGKKPRPKQLDRTAVYLSQDPRSPPKQGTDVNRTPIQVSDTNDGEQKENFDTPVAVNKKTETVPLFDPRSPGVERSPIIVTAEDGTPVLKPKDKTTFKSRLMALQNKE